MAVSSARACSPQKNFSEIDRKEEAESEVEPEVRDQYLRFVFGSQTTQAGRFDVDRQDLRPISANPAEFFKFFAIPQIETYFSTEDVQQVHEMMRSVPLGSSLRLQNVFHLHFHRMLEQISGFVDSADSEKWSSVFVQISYALFWDQQIQDDGTNLSKEPWICLLNQFTESLTKALSEKISAGLTGKMETQKRLFEKVFTKPAKKLLKQWSESIALYVRFLRVPIPHRFLSFCSVEVYPSHRFMNARRENFGELIEHFRGYVAAILESYGNEGGREDFFEFLQECLTFCEDLKKTKAPKRKLKIAK